MHLTLTTYWVFGLGFLAQSLFGFRIFYQWWLAEKAKAAVSPSLFWKLSLAASALFLLYGILRVDIVIILGQMIGYFVYIRNLQLKNEWSRLPSWLQAVVIAIPFAALTWTFGMTGSNSFSTTFFQEMSPFFLIGVFGQLLLNVRFIYQLYYSEQHNESILPLGFWLLSLAGSALVVIYAIYRVDPVLMFAQGIAIVPYVRNIVLAHSKVS
jgi:lipid-A-disaccharide synthase-like uncharacterized protein